MVVPAVFLVTDRVLRLALREEYRAEFFLVVLRLDCPVESLVHHCSSLCLRFLIAPALRRVWPHSERYLVVVPLSRETQPRHNCCSGRCERRRCRRHQFAMSNMHWANICAVLMIFTRAKSSSGRPSLSISTVSVTTIVSIPDWEKSDGAPS